jgi:ABC-type transporter Mla MlaB component
MARSHLPFQHPGGEELTAVPRQLGAAKRGWFAKLVAIMWPLPTRAARAVVLPHANAIPPVRPFGDIPPGTVVIRASDDLAEEEAVRVIHAQAREAIAGGATMLLVDLAEVIRADTKIVACLVVLRRMAQRSGCALDVRLSPAVAAWTGVCRVQQVIRDEDSRNSAA